MAMDAPCFQIQVVGFKSASPSLTLDLGPNSARQSHLSDMGKRLQFKQGSLSASFK